MKKILFLLTLPFISFIFGCDAKKSNQENRSSIPDSTSLNAIYAEGLARNIEVLASDEVEGRKHFTGGEEKTIHYLKREFEQLGLQPGNGDSFFQEVPLIEINSVPQGQLNIQGKGGELSLNYLDDYVALSRRVKENIQLENSELV